MTRGDDFFFGERLPGKADSFEGMTVEGLDGVVELLVYLTLELVIELADFDTFAILCLLKLVGFRSSFELLVL